MLTILWIAGIAFFIGRITAEPFLNRKERWLCAGLAVIWPLVLLTLLGFTLYEEWFA